MKKPIGFVFLAIVVLTALLSGCDPVPNQPESISEKGFGIYLLAQKITPDEMLQVNISDLKIEEHPILSMTDIVKYSKDSFELELTSPAYETIGQLDVPVSGLPFVVCVDRQPIYGGAFWVGYSSLSFNGIVIDILDAQQYHPIRIVLGYPESPELFVGNDPRSDPRILQSLENIGKRK